MPRSSRTQGNCFSGESGNPEISPDGRSDRKGQRGSGASKATGVRTRHSPAEGTAAVPIGNVKRDKFWTTPLVVRRREQAHSHTNQAPPRSVRVAWRLSIQAETYLFKTPFDWFVGRERLARLRIVEKVQTELRALSRRVIFPVPQLMNQPSNPSSGKSTITIVHTIFVIGAC